jgi:hypothetical protein
MKRIFMLIVATVFAVTFANAQSGWVDHKGDNRISVKFPSEPKAVDTYSFLAMGKDSTAYIFTIVDLVQVSGLDSAALAPMKTTPEFADQIKAGLAQSLSGVDLSDVAIGTWKGFTSYTLTGKDAKLKKYNIFMFIISAKLYSFSTVALNGASTEGHDIFLNSIVLSN